MGAISLPTMLMMVIFSFVIFNQIEAVNNASHVLKVINATLDKIEEIDRAEFLDQASKEIRLV